MQLSNNIPVLNVPLVDFQNCMHDVIQVEKNHTACCKKRYTCILLTELNNIEVARLKLLSLSWFDAYVNLYWYFNFFSRNMLTVLLNVNN